jgi:GrpB-like predicted nucleotidyltransferase (UPF0157 family)/RimJ/RimL family protein N-acetyltransferase
MTVVVEPYNPSWPSQFEAIKLELKSHLASVDIVSIEHVGSTSVPNLVAKPIIDIDIIVTRENVQPAIDALVGNGKFSYLGELGIVDRHVVKDPNQLPRRNTYICVDGAFQTRNHLGVRDTLRANSELCDEYGTLKLRLAAQSTSIVDYTEAKGEILQKILAASNLLTEEELKKIEKANEKGVRFGAIKTKRLVLREFMLTDDAAYFELEGKEEVVRYQDFGPRTEEEAKKLVEDILRDSCKVPRSHVELAVECNGKFVGRVGASIQYHTGFIPTRTDLWFSFLPECQGQGFATEAMQAFIPLLGGSLELEIECDPRNERSWKLAERLGFQRISLTEKVYESKGEWVDSLVYRKLV